MLVFVIRTRMDLAVNLVVVILLSLTTLFSMITCQSVISHQYVSVKAADGSPICTTEQPSKVVAMSAGRVRYRCGKECTQCTTCILYQANEMNKQCQLFNYLPQNFTSFNACAAYYSKFSNRPWGLCGWECEIVKGLDHSERKYSIVFTDSS